MNSGEVVESYSGVCLIAYFRKRKKTICVSLLQPLQRLQYFFYASYFFTSRELGDLCVRGAHVSQVALAWLHNCVHYLLIKPLKNPSLKHTSE